MHDLISGFFSSLSSRLLLLILLSTALPGCANQVRVPSENFNTRVSLLVIHHTTENFAESLETLTKKSGYPVSSHYLIPEPDDPTYDQRKLRIYELVPETHRAWHAGDSYWGGRTSLNDQSIGIELVNRTHCHRSAVDTGDGIVEAAEAPGPGTIDESTAIAGAAPASICFYPDFAESQIDLLVDLLEDVLKRHPSIKPTQIVGHSDIAPDRKIDPGPRFPWQRLYRHGFGAWYDDDTVIRYWERFRLQPLPLRNVQRALGVYGYRIEANGKFDVQTRDVLRAFQMHFRPAQSYGSMTTETVATLFALIEKYYPEQLDDLLRVDDALEEPARADAAAPCEVGVYRGPDGDFATIVERDHTATSGEWRYTLRNGEYGSTKEGVVRCVPGAIMVTRGGDAEERWPAASLKVTPTRFASGDVTLAGLLIEPVVDSG
ncbi:MAG TPA: N-acetylmuramoyl-L-alanine amidase, partial [Woeseiaceae bacterium]|nr:N-acetylmuramoyl-L-alanine amidase [Woeseiaceae bacterium]